MHLRGHRKEVPQVAQLHTDKSRTCSSSRGMSHVKSAEVVLAHPLKTRAIASARIKTDRIDSATLAHLLRTDLVPRAYLAPRSLREVREVLRYRVQLVRLRTTIKNRVHALLAMRGLMSPVSDLFG